MADLDMGVNPGYINYCKKFKSVSIPQKDVSKTSIYSI